MTENASRRRFLQAGLTLIPVVGLASQGLSVEAATHASSNNNDHQAPVRSGQAYQPRFFSTEEWAFLCAATEQLIPADDLGPGANDCGIPEFIDRQMDTRYGHGGLWYMQGPFITDQAPELGYQQKHTPRDIYRFGIEGCDDWCKKTYSRTFSQLSASEQVAVLRKLEAGEVPIAELKSPLFFAYLLKNSKEGYFADPIYGGNRHMTGWKMIGFPGARADYMDWIDHPNQRYPLGPVSISGERG